ncbi:MAG: hypothetical protein U1E52_18655 [Geminicoccaceae bacterium]
MAFDTLEMALAMRRSGLPQEQADTIAEQIGKSFTSEELATKEFVRAEISGLRAELHREISGLRGEMGGLRGDLRKEMGELRAELHKELNVQSWKMAGMLLLQASLVAALTRLF